MSAFSEHVYLEHTEDGHFKFWEAIREGKEVTVHWGKINTKGQSQYLNFSSQQNAEIFVTEKDIEKLHKGYREGYREVKKHLKKPMKV
jgi:predicted DNA-binding WGR domain protein